MCAKLWSIWLIVLITSPFTAPFSACDPSQSIGDATTRAVLGEVPHATSAVEDDSDVSVERVQLHEPLRLCALTIVRSHAPTLHADVTPASASAPGAAELSSRSRVLRL